MLEAINFDDFLLYAWCYVLMVGIINYEHGLPPVFLVTIRRR